MAKNSLEVHSAWCGAKFLRKRKLQSTNTTFPEFSIVGGGGTGGMGVPSNEFYRKHHIQTNAPYGAPPLKNEAPHLKSKPHPIET